MEKQIEIPYSHFASEEDIHPELFENSDENPYQQNYAFNVKIQLQNSSFILKFKEYRESRASLSQDFDEDVFRKWYNWLLKKDDKKAMYMSSFYKSYAKFHETNYVKFRKSGEVKQESNIHKSNFINYGGENGIDVDENLVQKIAKHHSWR